MSLNGNKSWSSNVKRDMSLYVRIGKGSSLRLRRAKLRYRKKGNVAELFINHEPKLKDPSTEEQVPQEPKEYSLGVLSSSSKDSSQISLDHLREMDFALHQNGEYGDVIVYGEKSSENDEIEAFNFDPQHGIRINTPPRELDFTEVTSPAYPYDGIQYVPLDVQQKITTQRWKILDEFMRSENANNRG